MCILKVYRLHITKQKSGLENSKMVARFKQLFDDHESGYMERLKKCSPPCLPFIGKHLELIFKKHECNKLHSETHRKQIWNEQRARMERLQSVSAAAAEPPPPSPSPSTPTISSLDQPASSSSSCPPLINFSKYRLLIEFVSNLLQYQNVR